MKKTVLTLILCIMALNAGAQKVVYSMPDGSKKKYFSEEIDICFTKPDPQKPVKDNPSRGQAESALGGVTSFLPTAVNMGFKWIDGMLAKRVAKFKAEHTRFQSNIFTDAAGMPDFTFRRTVILGNNEETALEIKFKKKVVDSNENHFVYYVDGVTMNYASAKVKEGDRIDLTISISPIIYLPPDGEKMQGEQRMLEVTPITIHSVGGDDKSCLCLSEGLKYRTNILILPQKAFLLGMTVSVVESNPRVIKAERDLVNWNTYRDDVKTGLIEPTVKILVEGARSSSERSTQNSVPGNPEKK